MSDFIKILSLLFVLFTPLVIFAQTIYAMMSVPLIIDKHEESEVISRKLLRISNPEENPVPSVFAFMPNTMLLYWMSETVSEKNYKLYFEDDIVVSVPDKQYYQLNQSYNILKKTTYIKEKRSIFQIPFILNLMIDKKDQIHTIYSEKNIYYKMM